jgi:hypothetical protein
MRTFRFWHITDECARPVEGPPCVELLSGNIPRRASGIGASSSLPHAPAKVHLLNPQLALRSALAARTDPHAPPLPLPGPSPKRLSRVDFCRSLGSTTSQAAVSLIGAVRIDWGSSTRWLALPAPSTTNWNLVGCSISRSACGTL